MKTRTVTSLAVLIVVSGALPAMAQTSDSHPRTAPKATPAPPSSSSPQSSGSNTKQVNGPSLEETLQWIKNALSSEHGVTWDFGYERHDSIKGRRDVRSEINTESGCAVLFSEFEHFSDGNITNTYNYATNLQDLDPSSLKVEKAGTSWIDGTTQGFGFMVSVSTTNLAKTISQSYKSDNISRNTQKSKLSFYISSEEIGQRLAKALSHAITVCGGKSSAF